MCRGGGGGGGCRQMSRGIPATPPPMPPMSQRPVYGEAAE